jgi:nicotinamide-nucleotide amidase
MKIALLITGSEILDGHVADANTSFLARELGNAGERLERVVSIRDNAALITENVSALTANHDIVVVSGGIGPTDDDVTMAAVAACNGKPVIDGIPQGAGRLKNTAGTADGAAVKVGNATILVFAGVPSEFRSFVTMHLIPRLPSRDNRRTDSLLIKTFGLREARINQAIAGEIAAVPGLAISYLPVYPEIHLRLVSTGASKENAAALDAGEKIIRRHLGDHVWGIGEDSLPGVMGERLKKAGYRLAVAESCTGGLLSDRITSVAGASEYFVFGAVTYSNEAKIKILGVPGETIGSFGAVSRETVEAMSAGVARIAGTEVSAAVSGIAGPGGGTPDKPVGTVHIAVRVKDGLYAEQLLFPWGREKFKQVVAHRVLFLIWRMLGGWRGRPA